MSRPVQPLRHSESTRTFPKHVNFSEPVRELEEAVRMRYEEYEKRRQKTEEQPEQEITWPKLKPMIEEYATIGGGGGGRRKEEGSDTEEYTSSESGSQDTVKFKGGISPGEGREREDEEEALYAEIDVKIDRLVEEDEEEEGEEIQSVIETEEKDKDVEIMEEEELPLPPPPNAQEIADISAGHYATLSTSAAPPPEEQQFYEEEYSYEPDLQQSSTKVVVRTRSLVSLDEEMRNGGGGKITTGRDGTFRFGGRKASSENDLLDDNPPITNTIISCGEELKKRKEMLNSQLLRGEEGGDKKKKENKYLEEVRRETGETSKERALRQLNQYLERNKIGLREILVNNNLVIIEPSSNTDPHCRIAGATAKQEVSNTLPRAGRGQGSSVQRHFFYPASKRNKNLKDEELPDPEKVRNARQMFQEVVKFARREDSVLMLPLSAQLSRRERPRTTPEIRVASGNKRWEDSGSLSSGVSSDMSCFDSASTDEEDDQQNNNSHPVSPEVMDKIRACGTSVTYYGGRVIAESSGPTRSRMTLRIMDEIRADHRHYFTLVKSNSCGSRLELAGADHLYSNQGNGRSLREELGEAGRRSGKVGVVTAPLYEVIKEPQEITKEPPLQSWRQLIESRKQNNLNPFHTSYQVIDQ